MPASTQVNASSRTASSLHWLERAWGLYPPAALAVAVLVVAAGCSAGGHRTHPAGEPRLALHVAEDVGVPGQAVEPETPRFASYPADLPLLGTAAGRATVRYGKDRLDLANLSKIPWTNARVWVNQRYSAPLPPVQPGAIISVDFVRLRDENGRVFPRDNWQIRIQEIELVMGDERTSLRFGLGY